MDPTKMTFSADFKALWEPDSQVRKLWDALEVFHQGLSEMATNQARVPNAKSLQELDAEMKTQSRPMEELFVDWVNLLWARIVLRTQLKARDSLAMVFQSCNMANAYGAALASRAILEHVALLQYFTSKVPWREKALVKKDALMQFAKDLQQLAFGSRFNWDDLLAGPGSVRRLLESASWSRPHEERTPPLGQLIGALDEELHRRGRLEKSQIQFSYSVLCDVVHPSWGGDFVYSPAMYREMDPTRKLGTHFRTLATLFCLPIVEVVKHLIEVCNELPGLEVRVVTSGVSDI